MKFKILEFVEVGGWWAIEWEVVGKRVSGFTITANPSP